jgi:1-hydroxycarotenoid 3,4-desaturase
MHDDHVIVVGAGMAGLVSAALLAQKGFKVTVLDAADAPGGKIRQVDVDGAAIDCGPTVFTMRWVFEEVYASLGTSIEKQLQITQLPVIAKHAWRDGSRVDLFADPQQSIEAINNFSGPNEAARYAQFCATIRKLYDTLEGPFIRGASPTLLGAAGKLGVRGLRVLSSIGAMQNLWTGLGRQLTDPRLQQLFARYATYCGSSPWEAPATLMLIAQVENAGVWSVQGGMHALAKNLETLARARGVVFHYGTRCERIIVEGDRVTGGVLADGQTLNCKSIVYNGDVAALRSGLLGPMAAGAINKATPPRSLSAITWAIKARTRGFELDRHNVFFESDYQREFDDIFKRASLPTSPTVYVCAQDRGVQVAPDGPERLLCLVNAPAVGDIDRLSDEAIRQCEQTSFSLLEACGLHVDRNASNTVQTTPAEFHQRFPGTGGALYGQATHGWMSAFARSGSNSKIKGLFLAGGSVHPGPGVPMAAISGQLAAEALVVHHSSTKKYHPVPIYGGTSTH